jgi:hypothetical protein
MEGTSAGHVIEKKFLLLHKHAVSLTTLYDFLNDFFGNGFFSRVFLGDRNSKVAKECLEPFGTPTPRKKNFVLQHDQETLAQRSSMSLPFSTQPPTSKSLGRWTDSPEWRAFGEAFACGQALLPQRREAL